MLYATIHAGITVVSSACPLRDGDVNLIEGGKGSEFDSRQTRLDRFFELNGFCR